MEISAIIVTRGNVAMAPVHDSLPPKWERIFWNNGLGRVSRFDPISGKGDIIHDLPDLGVYGRYAALEYASHDVIFVQDDDVVLAPESFDALLEAYEPGVVTANMTEYHQLHTHDNTLIGFGAVFDRDLPGRAFERYWETEGWGAHPLAGLNISDAQRALFLRTCDIVFTALTPRRVIDTPYTYLPWASDDNRMSRQGGFAIERQEVLDQLRESYLGE